MIWALYCLAAILTIFLWNIIHEGSHVLAAKTFGNLKSWSMKPYPHMYNGSFVFASVHLEYKGVPSKRVRSAIYLAPRVADSISIGLISIAFLLSGVAQILLLIFCFGGIIDLFIGSIGYSKMSDLRRIVDKLGINAWKLRIPGFLFCLIGVGVELLALLY